MTALFTVMSSSRHSAVTPHSSDRFGLDFLQHVQRLAAGTGRLLQLQPAFVAAAHIVNRLRRIILGHTNSPERRHAHPKAGIKRFAHGQFDARVNQIDRRRPVIRTDQKSRFLELSLHHVHDVLGNGRLIDTDDNHIGLFRTGGALHFSAHTVAKWMREPNFCTLRTRSASASRIVTLISDRRSACVTT
jgi:hypothetical protein